MSREEIAVRLTEAILSNPSLNVPKAAKYAVQTYEYILNKLNEVDE